MTTADTGYTDFLYNLLRLRVPVFAPKPRDGGYDRGKAWQQYTADGNAARLRNFEPDRDALCALCGSVIAVMDADPRNGCDPERVRALLNTLYVQIFAE